MPVMTPAEEARLRRYLNASHVASARRNGVRAWDRETVDSLIQTGRLVALEDSTRYWIVRPRTAPTHVVPQMRALLETLGLRFQERLAALDLPPYRIEVTSALRTAERQARLRRSNANAAAGASSHEFGATVDLSYAAFAPPYETPDMLPPGSPDALRPHVDRLVDLALESVSARKSRELGRIFSDVLAEAQDEGIALVIYERQQTVYHLTVGDRMSGLRAGARHGAGHGLGDRRRRRRGGPDRSDRPDILVRLQGRRRDPAHAERRADHRGRPLQVPSGRKRRGDERPPNPLVSGTADGVVHPKP
jgi:hypothetical protein